MNLSQIVTELECDVLVGSATVPDFDIANVCACDMMSDVLVVENDNLLLMTSLTTEQIIRTADIVGARAVLVTNGKHPLDKTLQLAREVSVPLLRTKLTTFEAAVRLGKLLGK